jgi:hypothetical protein
VLIVQQQNQPTKNDKPLRGFLPWIILGIGLLIMLVGIIVSSTLKDKSPPRPLGPAARIPKVNLIIHSNVGGAEVYLNDQQKAIVSDTQHKAMLFNLAPKTYQITLKKQGYADRTETIEITGQTISQIVEINLQPRE